MCAGPLADGARVVTSTSILSCFTEAVRSMMATRMGITIRQTWCTGHGRSKVTGSTSRRSTTSISWISSWPGRAAQNCRRQTRTFGEFVALAYPGSEPAHFDQVHERRRGEWRSSKHLDGWWLTLASHCAKQRIGTLSDLQNVQRPSSRRVRCKSIIGDLSAADRSSFVYLDCSSHAPVWSVFPSRRGPNRDAPGLAADHFVTANARQDLSTQVNENRARLARVAIAARRST
jgi:hypothetical protein